MKLVFSGAQGTGKSTLIRSIRDANEGFLHDYAYLTSGNRELLSYGIPINANAENYDVTQTLILKNHVCNFTLYRNSVLDRGVLDAYVWTKYLHNLKKVSEETMTFAFMILSKIVHDYDAIFYLEPEFDPEADGIRMADTKYRDDIVDIFEDTISRHNIGVVRLKGSVENRREEVLNIVGWHGG